MELIDAQHGIPTLLASIAVVLSLHFFMRLGEFVFKIFKKKSELSEQTIEKLTVALQKATTAVEKLDDRLVRVEADISQINKLKQDLRRYYAAIKHMAGDNWQEVRSIIMEEDLEV